MESASAPWVDGLTIGEVLRQTAQRFPDRDALVVPQFQYRASWREFDQTVDTVARALLALKLKKGDHLGLWATNWPHWVELQFAAARIGVVLVTVNPAYRSHELAYVLKQSDAVALFLVDRFRQSDFMGMLLEAVPEVAQGSAGAVRAEGLPHLRHVVALTDQIPPGVMGWSAFLNLAERTPPEALDRAAAEPQANEPINVQYTSGTTGFPKGATLSHRNILMNAWYIGDCQRLTELDRICINVPFYHCFGCVLGTLACAAHGAAMIVPFEYFRPEEGLLAIEQEHCTAVYGVPTMFIAMLDHPTRASRDLSSLRTGIMAGSPCPIEIMRRVVNEMGCREITIAYGLTEASPVITQTRTDDPIEVRVQTVGRPLPGVTVKLIDPANGETITDDRPGELCCQGHGVMLGYYNMPEQTARTIDREGWLHSGDLASRTADGYYRITGRLKDMVCRGGENIYPREIEEFLYTHPAVQDVAVVGVPDAKYIEEVCAWIRLRPGHIATEDELRVYCKANLAHFKVPRYIRIVTEFPQTVTGKIQKFKIREAMIEELKLRDAASREMA